MMASGKAKRNAAIGLGALVLLLFGTAAMASEEDGDDLDPDPDPDPDGDEPWVFDPDAIPDLDPGGGDEQPQPEDDGDGGEPWVFDPDALPDLDPGGGEADEEYRPERYEHPDNYPTPGLFHRVESGDIFFGKGSRHNMAWAALYEAAYQAALDEGGVSDAEARTFAASIAGNSGKRSQYVTLILCSPWNDALYGTYGFGSSAYEGPHGRSIRLMPYHASNRQRIRDGLPPIRNIELGKVSDKRKGNAGPITNEHRKTWEYLWFPPLNLRRLWESGEITTKGLEWEDGSNMLWPPPMIANLGIDTMQDLGNREFGCLGVTGTFE